MPQRCSDPALSVHSGKESVPRELWPDAPTGLGLEATRRMEAFFLHQREPLPSVLILFRAESGRVVREALIADDTEAGLARAAVGMLWGEATREGSACLGAVEVSEIPLGVTADLEGPPRKGLMVVAGAPGGWLRAILYPFHRPGAGALPILDGFPELVADSERLDVA